MPFPEWHGPQVCRLCLNPRPFCHCRVPSHVWDQSRHHQVRSSHFHICGMSSHCPFSKSSLNFSHICEILSLCPISKSSINFSFSGTCSRGNEARTRLWARTASSRPTSSTTCPKNIMITILLHETPHSERNHSKNQNLRDVLSVSKKLAREREEMCRLSRPFGFHLFF